MPSKTHTVQTTSGEPVVTDLGGVETGGPSGVLWGLDSPELNANLVKLQPGNEIGEHVVDLDVFVIVRSGMGELAIDGVRYELDNDSVALIPAGATRSISTVTGMVYMTCHQRRGLPTIS